MGVPELAGKNDESLLDSLGADGATDNLQATVTGGGSFKLLGCNLLSQYMMASASLPACLISKSFFKHLLQHPRITYPTIQQNVSACSLLPIFIEVAGRKMDATDRVLD